jgi:hypothetical protein
MVSPISLTVTFALLAPLARRFSLVELHASSSARATAFSNQPEFFDLLEVFGESPADLPIPARPIIPKAYTKSRGFRHLGIGCKLLWGSMDGNGVLRRRHYS